VRRIGSSASFVNTKPFGPAGKGEFVEAGLLRQYRRVHRVPLQELRDVIDRLPDALQVAHPLAHQRPYIGLGRRLMWEIQEQSDLDPEFALVAIVSGQQILTQPATDFVDRVGWSDDIAVSWRPHDDPASPVRMTPDLRFGLPTVEGIRTEVIWEQLETGASFDEVAVTFGIDEQAVGWAFSYENSLRSPRPLAAA
jgi:uncharacterized protein (DUF433 family)